MTTKQIEKAQAKMNSRFETAKKIRAMLDEAKKAYGEDEEEAILEIVTGEEE